MRILRVEQQTHEWDELHRGRVTASNVGRIFAGPKTKAYQSYFQLMVDDLNGEDRWHEDFPWFEHGKKYEGDARLAYEWRYECSTWNDCFLIHDEWDWLGCSPDFLIGPESALEGGGEIKCRKRLDTYLEAVSRTTGKWLGLTRDYYLQIQTAMLITGFEVWDYCNYYLDRKHHIQKLHCREIPRNEAVIDEIIERAVAFRAAYLTAAMES